MPASLGDAAPVRLKPLSSGASVTLMPWYTRCLLLAHRVLQGVPGLRSQSELLKGVLRRIYAWLLRGTPRALAPDIPSRICEIRLDTRAVPLPPGWDLDTERWARRLLEGGDPTAPFPAWDRAESESDAMRLRGSLPLLAEHYAATGEPRVLELISVLLASMVERARHKPQWAWDTTNSALRIITLLRAHETFRSAERSLPDDWDHWLDGFLSLHEPPLALGRAVEPDGNHALINAAGRAAYSLLRNPDRSLPSTLRKELERIFAAQFLPDGGHVERSPHYHLQALALFRFVVGVDAGRRHAEVLPPACAWLPLRALARMVAPDGRLYRFGDAGRSWSGRDLRAEVRDVLEWEKNWGGEGGPDLSAHFGLIVWEWTAGGRVLRMVADVGPLGNEANPGHGHADALSFCLYVDGEELVTDPGTFSYCSDPASTWFKLQEAHSTVHWIDTPSHQLSGYYHWKRLVDRPEITAGGAPSQRVLEATQQWCVGRSRFEHRRSWTANDAGLVVVDRLKCPVRERAASRLQLAPGTQVETERDGSVLLESRNGVRLRIIARTSVAALARRAEGWYAEAYGRRCAAPAVEWHLDRGSASRQLQLDLAVIP